MAYRVGLIGFGNIGSGLVRHLVEHEALLAERLGGEKLELAWIGDREFDRPRGVTPPATAKLTTNWREIIADPTVNGIVELVGVGADGKPSLAVEIARAALKAGKDFVTANKGLIAAHGAELHDLAEASGALLLYEASVGAGIPLITALQQGLAANRIDSITGIVNGTCNYILTELEDKANLTMEAAVKEAQRLGYAEPDPSFDVNGNDAAYKICILASLAFGREYRVEDVALEGITKLGRQEYDYARRNGLALKNIASATLYPNGGADLWVGPAFVPARHVIAGVRNVFNAVVLRGEPVPETMVYGAGAGQQSTGSGLIADLMVAARSRRTKAGNPYPLRIGPARGVSADPRAVVGRHYVRLNFAHIGDKAKVMLRTWPWAMAADGERWVSFVSGPLTQEEFKATLAQQVTPEMPIESITHVRFALQAP